VCQFATTNLRAHGREPRLLIPRAVARDMQPQLRLLGERACERLQRRVCDCMIVCCVCLCTMTNLRAHGREPRLLIPRAVARDMQPQLRLLGERACERLQRRVCDGMIVCCVCLCTMTNLRSHRREPRLLIPRAVARDMQPQLRLLGERACERLQRRVCDCMIVCCVCLCTMTNLRAHGREPRLLVPRAVARDM